MKKITYMIMTALLAVSWSCNDDKFLNRPPTALLTEDQVYANDDVILSVLGDLYNRYSDFGNTSNWASISDFNEAFWSNAGSYGSFQNSGWNVDMGFTWDYGYLRDINMFLQKVEAADKITQASKDRFAAEARFLRASYYFEMVKREGGVPIILEPLTYDFSGDPSYLQYPRAKESEVYDFVIKEAEEIKAKLPASITEKSRATKGAALAMEARAALYAGSIAKYGVKTPTVSLPGGEVGIPADKAVGYYTIALRAAKEIIGGSAGAYALYTKKPDLSENFAALFYDKANNPEPIFVNDYQLKYRTIGFTISNQPRFGAEEEEGGRINPSLNLVQAFEKLDNTYAPIPTGTSSGSGTPIFYNTQLDIFAGRDARLGGTVMLPGSQFKGRTVDIWAGVRLANGTVISGDDRGGQKTLPGTTVPRQVVGFDGPIDGFEFTAQTGFYIRKYQDPIVGSGRRGTQSEVWFIRYRYADVLLTAAEASFELGDKTTAAGYMNQVRARAGLTTPLTAGEITFDRVVHERRVEFAFEGLEYFDIKRWRLGQDIFDGVPISSVSDLTANIGKATKHRTQPWALWPYKVYAPGTANDGKWVYQEKQLSRVTGSDRWQLGNYYTRIPDAIISNNPKLVRNPNQ